MAGGEVAVASGSGVTFDPSQTAQTGDEHPAGQGEVGGELAVWIVVHEALLPDVVDAGSGPVRAELAFIKPQGTLTTVDPGVFGGVIDFPGLGRDATPPEKVFQCDQSKAALVQLGQQGIQALSGRFVDLM